MGRSSIGTFVGTEFHCRHWLSLDPCGLLCLSFSFSLHVFALVASALTVLSHHLLAQVLYGVLYVPLALLALWSLFAACTTDPGAVPLGARPIPANLAVESDSIVTERDGVRGGLRRRRGIRRCRKCNDNYKPGRAHHDSVTGRCVVKMDHYCPWVGNAVGIMNHKFFILFILYTFLTACVSLALILIRVIRCQYFSTPGGSDKEGCAESNPPLLFVLGVVTLLFFFFTFCMLLEQTEAVSTNVSKIARMKTRAGLVSHPDEYAPVATEFNEVFGGTRPTLAWHWLLPLQVRFPEWAWDNIMGYEWDVTFDRVPYQEPYDTDADSTVGGSLRSGRSGGGGGLAGGGGGAAPPLGGMDVEAGGVKVPAQVPLEQELLKEETTATPLVQSTRAGESGMKKRSTSTT